MMALLRATAVAAILSAMPSLALAMETLTLRRADGAPVQVRDSGASARCGPAAIISHGLGGTAGGSVALAGHLVAAGWRVIALNHAESGPAVLREAVTSGRFRAVASAAASDPARHRARFADLDAALAEATRACRPSRLVLIGHSMGATTTMLEAGTVARFGRMGADRFDAYVALSPQGIGYLWAEGAWAAVSKPVLMITGTEDQGFDGDWRTRLPAFEGLPPGRKRLAVLPGVRHGQLSGRQEPTATTIAALIVDFIDGLDRPRPPRTPAPGVEIRDR